jgi:hypothetical protein
MTDGGKRGNRRGGEVETGETEKGGCRAGS